MEKIRKKKKNHKKRNQKTQKPQKNRISSPFSSTRYRLSSKQCKIYITRVLKKKKKLLLQTPGPNFFSDGQTEERSGWKANV